jgi:hypothetical protein
VLDIGYRVIRDEEVSSEEWSENEPVDDEGKANGADDSGEQNRGDDKEQDELDEDFSKAGIDWERSLCSKLKARNQWRSSFLRRQQLSIRKPHIKRPTISDKVYAIFLAEIEKIFSQEPQGVERSNIFNCEDSNRKHLSNNLPTIVERKQDGVTMNIQGNEK